MLFTGWLGWAEYMLEFMMLKYFLFGALFSITSLSLLRVYSDYYFAFASQQFIHFTNKFLNKGSFSWFIAWLKSPYSNWFKLMLAILLIMPIIFKIYSIVKSKRKVNSFNSHWDQSKTNSEESYTINESKIDKEYIVI
jgi:hypothetical protein